MRGKDFRLFFREHFRRDKVTLRQRRRAGGKVSAVLRNAVMEFVVASGGMSATLQRSRAGVNGCRKNHLPPSSDFSCPKDGIYNINP
jgi:hypothetical protein